jgi:hypothetical protein
MRSMVDIQPLKGSLLPEDLRHCQSGALTRGRVFSERALPPLVFPQLAWLLDCWRH